MCFTSRTITVTVYYNVRKILYACKADTERHIIYLVWKWIRTSIETLLLLVCVRISPGHLQIASILLISRYSSYFWEGIFTLSAVQCSAQLCNATRFAAIHDRNVRFCLLELYCIGINYLSCKLHRVNTGYVS